MIPEVVKCYICDRPATLAAAADVTLCGKCRAGDDVETPGPLPAPLPSRIIESKWVGNTSLGVNFDTISAEIESTMSILRDRILLDEAFAARDYYAALIENSTRAEPVDGGNGGQANTETYPPGANDRD